MWYANAGPSIIIFIFTWFAFVFVLGFEAARGLGGLSSLLLLLLLLRFCSMVMGDAYGWRWVRRRGIPIFLLLLLLLLR